MTICWSSGDFMHKARQTQAVLNEIPFQKRQNCVLPSKSGDGKQELVEAF